MIPRGVSDGGTGGLAVRCTGKGRILSWLVGGSEPEPPFNPSPGPGSPEELQGLVDPVDHPKARNFLSALRQEGAAFDWQLHVRTNASRRLLHFAGVEDGDAYVVVAAPSRSELTHLNEELMRINNEQTNTLRSMARVMERGEGSSTVRARPDTPPQDAAPRRPPATDEARFDELTRVNNELANLQREMARKNAQLRRLNEEKNRFLGMAAHDIRTPLGVILSYARFLEDEAGDRLTEEELRFLEIILRNSDFLLRMVDDLLDVTAIEAGRLELRIQEDDLTELTRRTATMLASLAAPKSVSVEFEDPDPGLPLFPFDADRMEQVLHNLIGNAVKFSDPGDTVQVRLGASGDQAVLEVEDSGRGIPDKLIPQLFQPFTRAGRRGTAGEATTGLGLLIVRRIVEGHRGIIQVQSQEGEGSIFTVHLPLGGHTPHQLPRNEA